MRLRLIGAAGAASALAITLMLSVPSAQGAPAHMLLAQPSPRPTLVPTATPQATALPTALPPTARPAQPAKEEKSEPAPQTGRITGTIIDLTTGAPVPNVKIDLGGVLAVSDVSGNYDMWLPSGSYEVGLMLSDDQGIAAQAVQAVEIAPSGTTVLHLSFRSPTAPTAAPAPEATAAPTAAPTEAPTAEVLAKPAVAPAEEAAGVASNDTPERLPVTGADDDGIARWLPLGLMLLFAGLVLGLRPVRLALLPASVNACYDDGAALLVALLTASPRKHHPRSRGRSDKALLDRLLSRDK